MKPVYQRDTSFERGECMRAAMASLFELDIEMVPNFILYGEEPYKSRYGWHQVYFGFIRGLGYEYEGLSWLPRFFNERDFQSVGGFFIASVPSRTYPGRGSHSVIVNECGVVMHDPNPNELWLYEDLRKYKDSGLPIHVEIIEPREVWDAKYKKWFPGEEEGK